MNNKQSLSVISILSLAASALLSGQAATAQITNPLLTSQLSAAQIGFVPPADDAAPRYTRGGATRSDCDALQILPEGGWGWTTKAQPTVMAYFKSDVQEVMLAVDAVDGSESYIYEEDEFFKLESEGLAELPMPNSLSELTPNKQYTWSMLLICENEPVGPNSTPISSGIKRVSPIEADTEPNEISWHDQATAYADAGLWYDLVSILSSAKAASPEDPRVDQTWNALLTSVGLDDAFEEFTSEG